MSYAAGTRLKFGVEGVVNEDGQVAIGCKTFRQAEIRDVAVDLEVTAPPRPELTWKAGTVLRTTGSTGQHGEFFLVDDEPYDTLGGDDGPKIWSLKSGTFSPARYWRDETRGDLVPVYEPGGDYTDSCTRRRRNY